MSPLVRPDKTVLQFEASTMPNGKLFQSEIAAGKNECLNDSQLATNMSRFKSVISPFSTVSVSQNAAQSEYKQFCLQFYKKI